MNVKFFHSFKKSEEDVKREKECIDRIKNAVSEKTGITNFIDNDASTVAFAGSKDSMKLMLEVFTQKSGDKKYLCASIDDDASWEEYECKSLDEFESDIVNYITNRINKTVKTVVEADGESYRVSSYYMGDNGEWVCFDDETTDSKLFKFLAEKFHKTGETIETYKLENES